MFKMVLENKFQQTNKNKINHINDNHIKFEVSLHFWGIKPTVCRVLKEVAEWSVEQIALCTYTVRTVEVVMARIPGLTCSDPSLD